MTPPSLERIPAMVAVTLAAGALAGPLWCCLPDERAPSTVPEMTRTPGAAPFPDNSASVRIMPLGDSITQGDSSHDTYRRPLWKTLMGAGYEVDFVGSLRDHHRGAPPSDDFDRDHEGHWGFRTDEILDRLRVWAQASRPDIVLVHLGSNDIFQGESVASTLDELGALVDAVREVQPSAIFLVAQIIPTNNPGRNARIRELNAGIPALARARSSPASPIFVVDQYTGFDANAQTYDGVHPNPDGEIQLSERWLQALTPVLTR